MAGTQKQIPIIKIGRLAMVILDEIGVLEYLAKKFNVKSYDAVRRLVSRLRGRCDYRGNGRDPLSTRACGRRLPLFLYMGYLVSSQLASTYGPSAGENLLRVTNQHP